MAKKVSNKSVKPAREDWGTETGRGIPWNYQEMKPGAEIVGIMTRIFSYDREGKEKFGAEIDTGAKERTVIFCNSVLSRILPSLPVPSRIRVKFLGQSTQKRKGFKPAYMFEVSRDKSYKPEAEIDEF